MNVYEAFDFNKVNNNNQQKTKALTKAAMDVGKNIAKQGVDQIKDYASGVEPEKIYSVLN